MLSYLKYSVSAVLAKVLALLGMHRIPESFEARHLLDGSVAVRQYLDYLQLRYKEYPIEHLERLWVEEVRLLKRKQGAEHEYISAKVVGPNGLDFYLAFERFRGHKIHTKKDPHAASTTSQTTCVDAIADDDAPGVHKPASESSIIPISSRHSSDSISPSRHADDRVTYIEKSRKGFHSNGDTVYRTLDFSSTEPLLYLYELVVLATTLHDAETQYLLRDKQCYFYAGTIVQVLQEVYEVKPNLAVTVYTTGSLETDRRHQLNKKLLNSKDKSKNKAGTWKGIPIYANLSPSNVKPLRESFTSDVEAFKQTVNVANGERQAVIDNIEEMKEEIVRLRQQTTKTFPIYPSPQH